MECELEDVRKNMRSWLFADNIRRAVVLGPALLMAKMGSDSSWGEDPVHPLPAVYQELVKLVLSNMDKLENKVDTTATRPIRSGGGGREAKDAAPTGAAVEDSLTERAFLRSNCRLSSATVHTANI